MKLTNVKLKQLIKEALQEMYLTNTPSGDKDFLHNEDGYELINNIKAAMADYDESDPWATVDAIKELLTFE